MAEVRSIEVKVGMLILVRHAVAVDRDEAVGLLGALAEVDHWRPWHTTVEHTR